MADVEIDTNVKDFTNRINFGIIVCTSGTRPTAVDGKTIYETDTDKLLIYNGASWTEITGGGAGDFLADGSVPMTGNIQMGTNKVTGLAAATANGDALRYEQITDASFINLLKNGDFESWSAGTSSAPDGWSYAQSGAGGGVARSSTHKIGTYSAEITKSDSGNSIISTTISDYSRYAGIKVTLGCWVKSANSVTDQIKLQIYDGVDSSNVYYQNSGNWEFLTLTHTVNSSPTQLKSNLIVITGSDAVSYFDGTILVEGSICPEFSPKPLVDDGKSIQIDSTTNSVTIGRDPTSDTEAATKKYVDDNAGLSNVVEDLTPQLGGDLDCNSKKITGVTEITTTTSILFKKV